MEGRRVRLVRLPWLLVRDTRLAGIPARFSNERGFLLGSVTTRKGIRATGEQVICMVTPWSILQKAPPWTVMSVDAQREGVWVDTNDPITALLLCQLIASQLNVSGEGAAFLGRGTGPEMPWLVLRGNGVEAPKRFAALPVPGDVNWADEALALTVEALWGEEADAQ